MPIALNISTRALAYYDQLMRRDAVGKAAAGIAQHISIDKLTFDDGEDQKAWCELVNAGLAVESTVPYGRNSRYRP
jgi:hypothetical protein